eukprot:2562764-Amphidinium_carterae.1
MGWEAMSRSLSSMPPMVTQSQCVHVCAACLRAQHEAIKRVQNTHAETTNAKYSSRNRTRK